MHSQLLLDQSVIRNGKIYRLPVIVLNNFDFINTQGEELVASLGWQSIEKRRDYFVCSQN